MNKLFLRFTAYAISGFIVFFVATPLLVSADWTDGLSLAGIFSGLPTILEVDQVIFNVLQWLLRIFTFLAVISFIVNGLMFILSGGNTDMATRAKKGVAYSIIGVAVGLSGYIILAQINTLLEVIT